MMSSRVRNRRVGEGKVGVNPISHDIPNDYRQTSFVDVQRANQLVSLLYQIEYSRDLLVRDGNVENSNMCMTSVVNTLESMSKDEEYPVYHKLFKYASEVIGMYNEKLEPHKINTHLENLYNALNALKESKEKINSEDLEKILYKTKM